VPNVFTLYGGTAVALQLGHRTSVDFDFFAFQPIDPIALVESIPLLSGARITQSEPDTLCAIVDRVGPVKFSFFGLRRLRSLFSPLLAPENGVKIAALGDLMAAKLLAVQRRAEAKDYIDIDAMVTIGGETLLQGLASARALHGALFSPLASLKALTFFEDFDSKNLPNVVRARLTEAVRSCDLDAVAALTEGEP
jgi:hypothetical protein